jgi:hypothetical protein
LLEEIRKIGDYKLKIRNTGAISVNELENIFKL